MNQLRLGEMIRLARFESGKGKRALDICKYYKSDYIGLEMIKTFFLTLVADVLILGLVLAGNLEWLLNHANDIDIVAVGSVIVILVIATMAIYLMVTFITASIRYNKAKRSVHSYEIRLRELKRLMYSGGRS